MARLHRVDCKRWNPGFELVHPRMIIEAGSATVTERAPQNTAERRRSPRALWRTWRASASRMVDLSSEHQHPSEVEVSVVIGASASESSLANCLTALEPQRRRAQIMVVEAQPSDASLRRRFPWAEFHERPGALVPELWRDGIEHARGRIVALTIAQMIPAADWVDAIIREHEQHDAVGGAIDPGPQLRRVDWAEYFCRYARDMPPFEAADRDDVAGDNASYKRALLVEEREHLRTGFWEPVIHPVLQRRGVGLWHTPVMLMRLGRSSGFGAFARQRIKHGRLYPSQRGGHFARSRHV